MNNSSQGDFPRLVELALRGEISAPEHAQLEALLQSSADLRKAYLEAVDTDLDLRELSQQDLPHVPARRASRKRFPIPWLLAVGTVAVVAMLVLVSVLPHPFRHDQSVLPDTDIVTDSAARLPVIIEAANARIFEMGLEPKPGQTLDLNREYVLTRGGLVIRFESGARAVLTAPCVFSSSEPALLVIRSGHCSVHAPPGAEGFRIQTPSAEIVDLGTRFVVDVSATGETDMLVVDGAATLSGRDAGTQSALLLKEGEAASIEPEQLPQKNSLTSNRLKFVESLPDRVIKYQTTFNAAGYADELLDVTVQRGGVAINFPRENLIRSRLTHFRAKKSAAVFTTRQGENLPESSARLALLDEDWSLVTGIINPQTPEAEPDIDEPVMIVEFERPVINGPGPDILLFDLQLLVYREQGDYVRVRSGDARSHTPVLQIERFDIDLASPFALDLVPHKTYRSEQAPMSVSDLVEHQFEHGRQMNVDAKALVVGIDLSDLGYAPGEALHRLQLLETNESSVDPVLIIGLP